MDKRVKKYFVVSILLMTSFLFPETDLRKLAARLPGSSGEERIGILTELAEGCRIKEPERALKYAREGLGLLRTMSLAGAGRYRAGLLHSIAAANIKIGSYETAQRYAKQSLEIAEGSNNNAGAADALYHLGRIHYRLGAYDEAVDYLTRALKRYKESDDSFGLKGTGKTHNAIGLVYWKLSDYSIALEHILKAGKIYEGIGYQEGLAGVYNNTAIIHRKMNDFEKAMVYYNKAWKIREETGDKDGIARILNNIGIIYKKQGKFEEALNYYKQSLKLKRERGSKKGIAVTINNIGELFQMQKDHYQALDYFTQSLQIKESLNDKKAVANTLVNIASSNRELGRYKEAGQSVNRALAIASEIKIKDEIRNAYKELSALSAALNDYPKALAYYKKYKGISDSIFNEKNSRRIAELQNHYENDKQEKEIALLKKDKQIQKLELVKQTTLKNSLLIVSSLVLILAFVIFTRYRLKLRVTRALRKEIEDRKKAEAELLKSQKLESIGILAGGIAHDFNNLLAVIIGTVTMAKDEIADYPKAVKMLDSAEKSSLQATELIQKLITFSKGGWFTPQPITLSAILTGTADHHPRQEPLLQNTSIPPDLAPIYGDERQLRQVMHNLLQNADEATGEQKKISIKAENISLNETNEFSLEMGDYVKVVISDNGRGIPPDHIDKIFDPYFSTKNTVTQKGMGLGLAICYSIIKKHNGHIAVTSEVGKGTTVDLYFPAVSS